MSKLLSHLNSIINKEACWTISNITAGNSNQIQLVIDVIFLFFIVFSNFYKEWIDSSNYELVEKWAT